MDMKKRIVFAAFMVAGLSLLNGQVIDSVNSVVEFVSSGPEAETVEGTIKGMTGTIQFDPQALEESGFSVCVDPNTIFTDKGMRDKHLTGKKFLGVKKFPHICFSSQQLEATLTGFVARGELTMKGVSQTVEIPFTFENNVFRGSIELNRQDYGVGYSKTGMVGNDVKVQITCMVIP